MAAMTMADLVRWLVKNTNCRGNPAPVLFLVTRGHAPQMLCINEFVCVGKNTYLLSNPSRASVVLNGDIKSLEGFPFELFENEPEAHAFLKEQIQLPHVNVMKGAMTFEQNAALFLESLAHRLGEAMPHIDKQKIPWITQDDCEIVALIARRLKR